MVDRERLRAAMIENAAEINRLMKRIHEGVKRRDVDEASRQEWSNACEDFHKRYGELWLPGGPHVDFYDRLRSGDAETIEIALCFLEVRPYFFRSGYYWKEILQKCNRAPMSIDQAERFADVRARYVEYRRLRRIKSDRGAVVSRALWPLFRRFFELFPARLSDNAKFADVLTVGDLYAVLCAAMKLEVRNPPGDWGTVRAPVERTSTKDFEAYMRVQKAWRETVWTPEDVWATLVATIRDVYQLESSFVVAPETGLLKPRTGDRE
jgi:hypothetical protein